MADNNTPLVDIRHLKEYFNINVGPFQTKPLKAVDDVSFTIDAGETLSWHSGAKDLFGRDRVIGVAPDIGAFEYDFDEKGAALMFR